MDNGLCPPKVNILLKTLALWFIALAGWKAEVDLHLLPKKFVAIMAPHTSNWDLIFIMGVLFALGLKFTWFAKKEAFRGPLGVLFKQLGGDTQQREVLENRLLSYCAPGCSSDCFHFFGLWSQSGRNRPAIRDDW